MRVLLLGGTAEARSLSRCLCRWQGVDLVTSLAGRVRHPSPYGGRLRVGGFGGVSGLTGYLRGHRVDLLVDATHPFAAGMSAHAVRAAERLGMPLLRLARQPWTPVAGDDWRCVASEAAAAELLGALPLPAGAVVFLALGSQVLAPFAQLARMQFLLRMVEAPCEPLPLAGPTLIVARGPFAAAAEQELLTRHGVRVLVTRNSGGEHTYAKLIAARGLALPVVMIERPPLPPAETVATVADALSWLEHKRV